MRVAISTLICGLVAAGIGLAATTPATGYPSASVGAMRGMADDRANDESLRQLKERLAAGQADPGVDASEAARRGEFGLILTGTIDANQALGVICHTPSLQPPQVSIRYAHTDYLTADVMQVRAYAEAFNRSLILHALYPDRDLCRPRLASDPWDQSAAKLLGRPAQVVNAPVHDLHEAARRGSAADVRRFLRTTPVNTLDGFGMSPLAWAVARNNGPAIEALRKAGADPWVRRNYTQAGAVYWAAALGRRVQFERLSRGRDKPWPRDYLQAAMQGGDHAIIARILAEPHEPLRPQDVSLLRPSATSLAPVLRRSPELADAALQTAIGGGSRIQLELVKLALANGANPNGTRAQAGSDTPLGLAAMGVDPHSIELVDVLVKSGADVNLPSARKQPAWIAVGMLKLRPRQHNEAEARAELIFKRLVAAGADLTLPNDEGKPPIWFLLFPLRYAPEEMDASFVTPDLLEMLVNSGMDLNATWRGRTVLSAVEAQAGADSELARALRRLGARE